MKPYPTQNQGDKSLPTYYYQVVSQFEIIISLFKVSSLVTALQQTDPIQK